MTTNCAALVVGAALIVGTLGSAQAADLNSRGGGLKDFQYAPMAAEASPRWYFRVDGSYAGYDKPSMVLNMDGFQQELTQPEIQSGWGLGGGVGMYFSKNVRGDLTYTHFFHRDASGRFNVDVPGGCADPCGNPVAGYTANVRGVNSLRSDVLLANVYYDFDMRSHFTPYIGLGLGGVHHSLKQGSLSGDGVTGTIEKGEGWSAAGALMAGFSVALRQNLHLDAGYRFLYLGDVATGATIINRPTHAADATPIKMPIAKDPLIEDIHSHEVRFGLRYDLR
jgi:opacity protein-like surface antigen